MSKSIILYGWTEIQRLSTFNLVDVFCYDMVFAERSSFWNGPDHLEVIWCGHFAYVYVASFAEIAHPVPESYVIEFA